jgi:N-acetylglucosamine-6-phosphate deacetylase
MARKFSPNLDTQLLLIFLVPCLCCIPCYGQNPSSVEGIFYLDGSPVQVEIVEGKIGRIRRNISKPESTSLYIAPGFIDNQVNGYASITFSSDKLTKEGVKKATEALWKEGVTTYLPTVTTNQHETLLHSFSILAAAIADPAFLGSIPGFHLEGPYISPVDGFRGSHKKEWVRLPDWAEFVEYYEASNRKILQVSLAPENEGALEFIRNCVNHGIVIGLAHHSGSAEVIKQAVDAGAAISTHLGNGCANMIHRHANPLWPQLADDRLMASIIVDGFHLRPEEVQVFFNAKGKERIVMTSDVTKFAGMPPGEYVLDGKELVITPEGMIKYPAQNVLAGAALPVTVGISNIQRFTGCSLADAVRLVTRNPARLYGLMDRGEIRPGKRADLVLFSIENGRVEVKKTIVAGQVVFDASSAR